MIFLILCGYISMPKIWFLQQFCYVWKTCEKAVLDWNQDIKLFVEHLQQQGIVHQVPCPYPSQQSGKVERRHQTIIGMTLNSFIAKVSLKLYLESVITVVFLINQLPSLVLPNLVSPYFMLYKKHHDCSSFRSFKY